MNNQQNPPPSDEPYLLRLVVVEQGDTCKADVVLANKVPAFKRRAAIDAARLALEMYEQLVSATAKRKLRRD